MAHLTGTSPAAIRQYANQLAFARYLSPDRHPRQAGAIIEADPGHPDLWDIWPVTTWDDTREAETRGRTIPTSTWEHLVWTK